MQSILAIGEDHPAYAGHFPALPVLPGAVLIDAVFDVVVQARHLDVTQWRIRVAKFLSAVRPGDRLTVEHEMANGGQIHFAVLSLDRAVATGTLTLEARAQPA